MLLEGTKQALTRWDKLTIIFYYSLFFLCQTFSFPKPHQPRLPLYPCSHVHSACMLMSICVLACPFKDLSNAVALSHWFNSHDCQGRNDKTDWVAQLYTRRFAVNQNGRSPWSDAANPACSRQAHRQQRNIWRWVKQRWKSSDIISVNQNVSVCNVWLTERQWSVSICPCIYFSSQHVESCNHEKLCKLLTCTHANNPTFLPNRKMTKGGIALNFDPVIFLNPKLLIGIRIKTKD